MMPEDIAANLIAEGYDASLPEPWVFDGTRRLYDYGLPMDRWTARAINPNEPFGSNDKVVIVEADTPMEAVEELVKKLQAAG